MTPPPDRTAPPRSDAPPPATPAARPVVLAVVTGAHGIGGEVKLKLFTDDLARYCAFNDGTLTLKALRGAIARFAEVADRNAAERLRGTELTVPRAALPPLEPGEYYHADLLGLPAFADGGEPLGEVVAIDDFGAGDVIEVRRPDGRLFMVAMRAVTLEPARLLIDPAFVEP